MKTDVELIAEARCGNQESFGQLVRDCLPKLQSLLFRHYHLQKADLDDVSQMASAKAWTKLETFRGDSSFLTWFYTILRNEALNYIKKRQNIMGRELSVTQMEPHTQNQWGSDAEYYEGLEDMITYDMTNKRLEETAASIVERQEELKIYREMIEDVMNRMTPIHREILKLVLDEEMSYKDVAEKLNIPVGTVMSRLFFARQHAQRLIKSYAQQHEVELPV